MTSARRTVLWHATGGDPQLLAWWCPGCDTTHAVALDRWTWNGSLDKPTLAPSVLSTGFNRCHCFVRDGRIQYLTDCEHALAGLTIDMVAPPEWLGDGETTS